MNAYVRFIFSIPLLFPLLLYAQGEQNIWPCGPQALDFNGGAPISTRIPASGSNAVCNASGVLQFAVTGRSVVDRNGRVMSNGNDLIYPRPGTDYRTPPIIAPVAHNGNRYAVINQSNGGLYYSLVDMQLNNGDGDIVPGKKNISLNAFAGRNGISTESKITTIPGCSHTWLLSRSRHVNQFRAYKISSDNIDTVPVISDCGLLPITFYPGRSFPGLLKASPDGRRLALACGLDATDRYPSDGALELYDFDKCSGTVTNPVVLDSGTQYYSVCFSPDNTKLYATTREWPGNVYQFDLSLPTPATVRASKTLVFTNPTYWSFNILMGWVLQRGPLGDLKTGPDGKIYFANGFTSPMNAYVQPTSSSPTYGHRLHVINEPNRVGLACNAVRDILALNGPVGIDLPPDIVLPPQQDTIYGNLMEVAACFRDSAFLQADTPGSCYRWDDGSDQPQRIVSSPGIYTVQYTDDHCRLHIDSFDVRFVQLPLPGPSTYSCPNEQRGSLVINPVPGDSTYFTYAWKDATGQSIATRESKQGDTLTNQTSGTYTVQIKTASGCDTTLSAAVLPLPLPVASFDGDTVVCKGQPLSFINTSEAPLWEWHFGNNTSSGERHPQHTYTEAGIQEAMLIIENIERCRDTLRKQIHVKHLELSLTATPSVLHRRETVTLQTHAPESYQVTAWLPEVFFADQHSFHQSIPIDTTRYFTVTAQSAYGCIDTATVLVTIHPVLFLPTAFSPNGDGRNDYFRPAVSGGAVTISAFRIFDRWGKEVWSGQGSSAVTGWDGRYNGVPAQVGTYYYTIEAETHTGKTIRQKGDVTLVR